MKTFYATGCLALALGACASANTPAQNLAYERWAGCRLPYSQLERIDVDGRITFLATNSSNLQEVSQCLVDAGRTGPRLPQPVGVRPSGGP